MISGEAWAVGMEKREFWVRPNTGVLIAAPYPRGLRLEWVGVGGY